MTPFLSEKKLTTSPGAGAGSTALLPAGLRAGPAAPPRKSCAPRVRAGAGRASGSTAGAADPPEGRGLHQPAAEAQPTSRSGADTRQVRAGSTSAGRGDGESAEGPGGGRAPPPVGAPHRGRGALKRRVCGRQGGGRLGLGNCGGEGAARVPRRPRPRIGAPGDTIPAIFPGSLAGPSDSPEDPLTRPRKPQKMPLPSWEASSDPGTSRVPSPAPPQNQQARGRDGGRRAAGPAVAEAKAPAPPPPAAATGTFVWRPLGLPRWGEGGRRKIPPGLEVRAPSRAALQRTAATDPLRLPPGKGPGGGRGGCKLKRKSLPPLRRLSSSLRTRLTGKHRFPPTPSAPPSLLSPLP